MAKHTSSPRLRSWLIKLGLVALVLLGGLTVYLDGVIRSKFEGKRWALPAHVYARPLELHAGKAITSEAVINELQLLGYRRVSNPDAPGEYHRDGNQITLHTRPFHFWDGKEQGQLATVAFTGNTIEQLTGESPEQGIDVLRVDPLLIGHFLTTEGEDRQLIKLQDVPPFLIKTLLAVEDRNFYDHWGISIRGIARAMWSNVRAGAMVQGGSTITQQLVKNFFLTQERTLWRKMQEAVMAILLEYHYSKDNILEAYLNEIYLGQDGQRAIHGFGLASQFYFDRPLNELGRHQISLLVGMIRGPSYYDPRRFPERAKERRDVVINMLIEQELLKEAKGKQLSKLSLDVVPKAKKALSKIPAALDLVKRQLAQDYPAEVLKSEGLHIFTSLDPIVQQAAERALQQRLASIEKQHRQRTGPLEGAVVVTTTVGGDVLAIVGSREPNFAGFNRALDAARSIGSLVKPAVYITALEQPEEYSLATHIQDAPINMQGPGGKRWKPQNYDRRVYGNVPLHFALSRSLNLATIRLGLDIGVDHVVDSLQKFGLERKPAAYGSLLLGAVSMSPLEVAAYYQTLASGGFYSPPKVINAVVAVDGTPLKRYPLRVRQAFSPEAVYLVNTALQEAVREGTGQALNARFPYHDIAGKTGTTDDYRDSWFSGFTGDYLATVWVGRDDNQTTGLSGASGALLVWGDLMAAIHARPLQLTPPDNIRRVYIHRQSGLLSAENCPDSELLPFFADYLPAVDPRCH